MKHVKRTDKGKVENSLLSLQRSHKSTSTIIDSLYKHTDQNTWQAEKILQSSLFAHLKQELPVYLLCAAMLRETQQWIQATLSSVFYSLERDREVTSCIRLDGNSKIFMGKLGRGKRPEDGAWASSEFLSGVPGRFPREVNKQKNFKLGEYWLSVALSVCPGRWSLVPFRGEGEYQRRGGWGQGRVRAFWDFWKLPHPHLRRMGDFSGFIQREDLTCF